MTATPREHAIGLHNRALPFLQTDRVAAYRLAASAVEVDPGFADGYLLLGGILADDGNLTAAVSAYRLGLRCPAGDGKGDLNRQLRHRLMLNEGHQLLRLGRLEEAEDSADAAVRFWGRDPVGLSVEDAAKVLVNRAMVYSHRGLDGAAVVDAGRAFEMSPEPVVEVGLAFALLFARKYAAGLKHFERRFEYKLQNFLNLPYPKWDGAAVGTLLVLPDQGLGDTLSMARFIWHARKRAERVIFAVQPELVGLFEGVFPEHVESRDDDLGYVEIVPFTHLLPPADAWTSVFGLAAAMELSDSEIVECPGLDPLGFKRGDINVDMKKDDFNIVISYAGAAASDIDHHRSIPPALFLALLDVPGVKLWSVQVGPKTQEMHTAGCAALMKDLSPWIRDARDTATVIDACDLVICCESFVGHLAGALGKECWVLCSKLGRDWRVGSSGDRPLWYDRTRLFRQDDRRTWGLVFADVVKALREKVRD